MKKRFGLLGEKLSHSFSPLIHSYLGDYDYRLFEVPPGELSEFMRRREFDGLNVTIPYKQAVLPYCATLSDEARAIGCVNTLVWRDGGLHGHNTDYHGFRAMLSRAGIRAQGRKALVLGSGGSSLTVRAALRDLGADAVVISRRGEDNYANISRHFDAQLIVNTTPVGMYPNNADINISLEGFFQLEGVADLIYNPLRTMLLLDAERLGVPCAGGLTMLVAQAEAASRVFLDCAPREELADNILRKLATKIQNIALIGMPGCGKSTAGRIVANILGRPFVDTDALIEKIAGKNITEIFAEDGEDAFRTLETQALAEAAKKNGIVIATGGGIVTRDANLALLRQNSLIIYLKRDLARLTTSGRPLSKGVGVAALAAVRLPLYEAWCDCAVNVKDDCSATVRGILQSAGLR